MRDMNNGPRVFVVQRPSYKADDGAWVEKYDLRPAQRHGRLTDVFGPGNLHPAALSTALETCKHSLKDFRDGDHLLALGDPVAIAMAVFAMTLVRGDRPFSVLKWDRRSAQYRSFVVPGATLGA